MLVCFLVLLIWLVWLGWIGKVPAWTGFAEYIPPSRPIAIPPPSSSSNPIEGYQPPKTMWDLLELIIIPIFLSLIAYVFTKSQRENERKLEDERTYAATMQAYLKQMTELLLEKGLSSSEPNSEEVRSTARAHTMATLFEIDGKRKGRLLQFLFEAGLIDAGERVPDELSKPWKEKAVVSLREADLSHAHLKGLFLTKLGGINLIGANLEEADLRGVRLSHAHLFEANLRKADLRRANLRDADLRNVTLCDADLRGATLVGADLRGTNLSRCKWDKKTDFTLARIENAKGIERIEIPPSPLESSQG